MNRKDYAIAFASVIAETACYFPLLSLLTTNMNNGRPLFSFVLISALILLGFVLARLTPRLVNDPNLHAGFQAVVGLGVVYVTAAFYALDGQINLLWGLDLISGLYDGATAARVLLAAAVAGLLWHRGVRYASTSDPSRRLRSIFRIGLVALAFVVVVEQASGIDLNALTMLMVFFTFCLSGLALSQTAIGGTVTSMVGIVLALVIGGGFLLGSFGTLLAGRGLALISAAWTYLETVILWVLYVLFYLIEKILPDLPDGGPLPELFRPGRIQFGDLANRTNQPPEFVLTGQLLKYLFIVLVIYYAYKFLKRAFEKGFSKRRDDDEGQREDIRDKVGPGNDMISLFLDLLPDWLRGSQVPGWPPYPKNLPGITEIYELYYELLTAAHKRGHQFQASATPHERVADLSLILPRAPVKEITQRFVSACYGSERTARTTSEDLRRQLIAATSSDTPET